MQAKAAAASMSGLACSPQNETVTFDRQAGFSGGWKIVRAFELGKSFGGHHGSHQ
jgi:hypothetical protein